MPANRERALEIEHCNFFSSNDLFSDQLANA